ncbi:MAG: glycosyltransferase family 2 protein [Clostridia bacterium]|nr:glycosyltransferase family 2 protein [Clostridia bacterium]
MVQILEVINRVVTIAFFVFYAYQLFYIPFIFLFGKRLEAKKKASLPEPVLHDFAVLICARNEEEVIGDLLDSLAEQTYPQDKLHVFVMADNCTDRTAEIARGRGAFVYERYDTKRVGKGYAMEALTEQLLADHPEGYDGYFVFDADNLLARDYVERMNERFSAGHSVVTGYRSSKNFDTGWVSAANALWFMRESRFLNHARYLLGVSCAVSGTGFLFSRAVMERIGHWKYRLLTEDLEFTADHLAAGDKIAFCADAVLYDEQPVTFRQSRKQRLRWARGYLQVMRRYGWRVFKGILRGSFSCYDFLMNYVPAYAISILSVLSNLVFTATGTVRGEDLKGAFVSLGLLLLSYGAVAFVLGLTTVIYEWKRIPLSPLKKLLSVFPFVLFLYSYIPISVAALFFKPRWDPISHTVTRNTNRQ